MILSCPGPIDPAIKKAPCIQPARQYCSFLCSLFTDVFSAFGGLYLGYISGTMKDYDYDTGSEVETKQTESGFSGRLGIGVAFALSPRFTAVGQYGLFGFNTVSYKNYDGDKTNTVTGFDFGVNTVGGSTFAQGNESGAVFNIGIYYTIKE